jgi:hypothetical protein
MKKIILILVAEILIVNGFFVIPTLSENIADNNLELQSSNDIPPWAKGNLTGEWGIKLYGKPFQPEGWIKGYYSNLRLGRFLIEAENTAVPNTSWFKEGIIIGRSTFGRTDLITDGGWFLFGRLKYNETHFKWVSIGIGRFPEGWPILIMKINMEGTYSLFE